MKGRSSLRRIAGGFAVAILATACSSSGSTPAPIQPTAVTGHGTCRIVTKTGPEDTAVVRVTTTGPATVTMSRSEGSSPQINRRSATVVNFTVPAPHRTGTLETVIGTVSVRYPGVPPNVVTGIAKLGSKGTPQTTRCGGG